MGAIRLWTASLLVAAAAGAQGTLTGLDGKTYSLAALRGKVVLLNFWATWCPPCRKEMPDMEKLSRAYADKGLAVSDEPRETVEPFIAKQQYTFPRPPHAGDGGPASSRS